MSEEVEFKKQWQTNLFLFVMGRVGSVSVKKAMTNIGLNPLHAHYLYTPIEPKHGNEKDLKVVDMHLLEPVKIITITRDPLARTVTAWVRTHLDKPYHHTDPKKTVRWIEENNYYRWSLIWWHNQFDRFTGAHSLDSFRRLGLKEHHNVLFYTQKGLVLALRNENLFESSNVLSTFIGKQVTIERFNVTGSWDGIRQAYLDFTNQLKFSKSVIDRVYNSKYVLSAYSKEEIEAFKEKWSA